MVLRVSVATGQAPAALWHAPYRRTLYEFYHLDQQDRLADIRSRGQALHMSTLMALAFHEPKRLREEHQRLLADAGLLPSADEMRAAGESMLQELVEAGWTVAE